MAKGCCLLLNYGTTVFALDNRAHLQPGETLLVTAAAGGVGSAAVQVGKAMGATVIGLAGGPEKVETVRQLGADMAFDYNEVDIVEAVRSATDGRGVDVVYEAVGGDVFQQVRRTVAWEGRLLIVGFTSGTIPDAPMNHALLKNYSIVGVHWGAWLARDPNNLPRELGSHHRADRDRSHRSADLVGAPLRRRRPGAVGHRRSQDGGQGGHRTPPRLRSRVRPRAAAPGWMTSGAGGCSND